MKRADDSFRFWLHKIREKPGLFLGEPSLTALVHFWDGYAFRGMIEPEKSSCLGDYNGIENSNMCCKSGGHHFLDGFEEFVSSYYSCEHATQGWGKAISQNCSSEAAAFDKFFELFDEFMKSKG